MISRSKIQEVLYLENGNCAAVARRFNTHRQSIHRILKQEGIDLRSFRKEIEKKKVAQAVELGATTAKEIVAQTKLGNSRVKRSLEALQLELVRGGVKEGDIYSNWKIIESKEVNKKKVKAQCLLCQKTYFVLTQSLVRNLSQSCRACSLSKANKQKRTLPIVNVTTGETYKSIAEAAKITDMPYQTFRNKFRLGVPILGCLYRVQTK